jgi:hypothetical protein
LPPPVAAANVVLVVLTPVGDVAIGVVLAVLVVAVVIVRLTGVTVREVVVVAGAAGALNSEPAPNDALAV